jgi:hypothetical protein
MCPEEAEVFTNHIKEDNPSKNNINLIRTQMLQCFILVRAPW